MIADAYFQCKPGELKEFRMLIMPDNDVLALDSIVHCKNIYEDSEKIICHVRLGDSEIEELSWQAQTMNPLDISAVQAIGITWTYLGRTLEGVFERYPELNGTKTVTDENGIREDPLILPHTWA